MALTDAEARRIRFELGYNVLAVGAEPYIGVAQIFEQVIAVHTTSGASTTSSTAVTAASSLTLATLTLASATGISAGDRIIVDVGARQESTFVQYLSGATLKCLLMLAHTDTYPVTVEGGESIIRAILNKLQALSGLNSVSGGTIDAATSSAGVKKVDEIEFFGGGDGYGSGIDRTKTILEMQAYWRDELASALGVVNLRNVREGSSGTISVY